MKKLMNWLVVAVVTLTVTGCTTLARKQKKIEAEYLVKISEVLSEGIEQKEPCNILCGRLKEVLIKAKEKIEQLKNQAQ